MACLELILLAVFPLLMIFEDEKPLKYDIWGGDVRIPQSKRQLLPNIGWKNSEG